MNQVRKDEEEAAEAVIGNVLGGEVEEPMARLCARRIALIIRPISQAP
jgi:hypothetical protein